MSIGLGPSHIACEVRVKCTRARHSLAHCRKKCVTECLARDSCVFRLNLARDISPRLQALKNRISLTTATILKIS